MWRYEEALAWDIPDRLFDWLETCCLFVLRAVCCTTGHTVMPDHCNLPEHRSCYVCEIPTPFEALTD
jgi:hypothetical protein